MQVISTSTRKVVTAVAGHDDVVTCLGINVQGTVLVTGCRDGTCMVWQVGHKDPGGSTFRRRLSSFGMRPRAASSARAGGASSIVSGPFAVLHGVLRMGGETKKEKEKREKI